MPESYVEFKSDNKIFIAVKSGHIYIEEALLKSEDEKHVWLVYFEKPGEVGPGGRDIDWKNASKSVPIARIYDQSEDSIGFDWYDVFNNSENDLMYLWTNFNKENKLYNCPKL